MRVLLIEDDPKLGPKLSKLLKQQKYTVDLVRDGLSGEQRALEGDYDTILLDINLPGQDGFAVAQAVRNAKLATPILMLTSRDSLVDHINGLDTGADDYLTKPFNSGELFARVRALLRRNIRSLPSMLEYDQIVMDPATHKVSKAGKEIKLMPKEYSLLEYLLRNSEQVVTRDELLRHVWGVYSSRTSNRLEVYIRYLRNKLDRPFKTKHIKTVRGVGYKLAKA